VGTGRPGPALPGRSQSAADNAETAPKYGQDHEMNDARHFKAQGHAAQDEPDHAPYRDR
jgi:hypothetical protein